MTSNDERPFRSTIQAIRLNNWGLFDDTSLKFDRSNGFVAITGETGAGKSIFLSALQYVSGETSSAKVRKINGHLDGHQCEVTVVFRSVPASTSLTRTFSSLTRKSNCMISGEKLLVRDLQTLMAPTFRFWSTNEIQKLDPDGMMEYIDRRCDEDILSVKLEVEQSYTSWYTTKQELQHLLTLQSKTETAGGQEVELLYEYKEELQRFFRSHAEIVSELRDFMSVLGVPVEDLAADALQLPLSTRQDIQGVALIFQRLEGKSTDQPVLTWSEIEIVESFLKKYNRIVDSIFSINNGNGGIENIRPNGKRSSIIAPSSVSVNSVPTTSLEITLQNLQRSVESQIIQEVASISTKINDLQLLQISDTSSALSRSLSQLQALGHDIESQLSEGLKALKALQKSLPNASSVLPNIIAVKHQWKDLAAKHRVQPHQLFDQYHTLCEDVVSIENLHTTLPLKIRQEAELAGEYIRHTSQLSRYRQLAARQLMQEVNALLPSLEMGDKLLNLDICTPMLNVSSDSLVGNISFEDSLRSVALANDLREQFSERGWDRAVVELHYSTQQSAAFVPTEDVSEKSSPLNPIMAPSLIPSSETSAIGCVRSGSKLLRDVLSSGEAARLALALETLSDSTYSSDPSEGSLPILVLDEIDAHVGGDAARAVSRLLQIQGKRRQVIAVTHNALLAASADVHVLVQRLPNTVQQQQTSIVRQLETTEERIEEIARMLVGTSRGQIPLIEEDDSNRLQREIQLQAKKMAQQLLSAQQLSNLGI